MSSSEDKKSASSPSLEISMTHQEDRSKSGNIGGESADGKANGAKPLVSSSKLTATAKEWKPSASAPSFQPRVQPQAMPQQQQQQHQQQGGFIPGYGQEGFYANMPQGYPMVPGPNGVPIPVNYYQQGFMPMPMPPMFNGTGSFTPQGMPPGGTFYHGQDSAMLETDGEDAAGTKDKAPGEDQGQKRATDEKGEKARMGTASASASTKEASADAEKDAGEKAPEGNKKLKHTDADTPKRSMAAIAAAAPATLIPTVTVPASASTTTSKEGGKGSKGKKDTKISTPALAPVAAPSTYAAKIKAAAEQAERDKTIAAARARQEKEQTELRKKQKVAEKATTAAPSPAPAPPTTVAEAVRKAAAAAGEPNGRTIVPPNGATSVISPKGGASGDAQWSSGQTVAGATIKEDKAPLQRGQVVTGSSNSPRNAGDEGWRRGLGASLEVLAERDDGRHRYEKGKLLSLFTRGKECPDEIKRQYPKESERERAPLLPKEGGHSGQGNRGGQGGQGSRGGRGNNSRGREIEEPHPDEAEIFDFSKKDDSTFRYKPTRLLDGTNPDVIIDKARAVLNKLSVTKFEKLSDEFMAVGIDDESLIERAVELVISKAQMEEHFCFMYADLCAKIHTVWDEGCSKDEESLGKTFRVALLNKCRDEFTIDRKEEITKIRGDASLSEEDKDEKEILAKKRYTGHMRFIGELYQKDMVNPKTMHNCLGELIEETDEETLVCMCKLMMTIGYKLESYDRRKGHENFVEYFKVVGRLSTEHPSSRMRFMMKDLMEARANGWAERREQEKAVHLNELRLPQGGNKSANKLSVGSGDARAVANRGGGGNGGVRGGDARNHSGAGADEWQTVPSSGKRGNRGGTGGFGSSGSLTQQGQGSGKSVGNGSGKTGGGFGALRGAGGGASSSLKNKGSKTDSGVKKPSSSSSSSSSSFSDAEDEGKGDGSPLPTGVPLSRQQSDVSVTSSVYDNDLPGFDGSLQKETVMKVRSIVEEYYMNEDPAEALLSLKELLHPLGMGEAIGASKGCIELVFEKFPQDTSKLCDLLVALWASGDESAFLSSEQATKAFALFLDNYDDMSIDVPKAGEYGATIMAHLIDEGVISLSLFDTLPVDNLFNSSYKRAGFIGGLLVQLAKRPGQTEQSVCQMYKECKTDVIEAAEALKGPKQSTEEAREEFLGKYPLQFLL